MGAVGRADHQGQHRRRNLRDGVHASRRRPKDGNVIWAGSDDGYVQVTRNGGTNWKNVTPKALRRLRAHQPDRSVAVPRRHRLRRREPLSAGRLQAVRVPHRRLRRDLDGDHQRRRRRTTSRARFARTSSSAKLLYLGTEHGIYVSFDDGANWESLRQNLPDTPVHDIAVEERDLVIATHGRGFYVMDNIAPLRQGGLQTTTQLPSLQARGRAARPRSQRRRSTTT